MFRLMTTHHEIEHLYEQRGTSKICTAQMPAARVATCYSALNRTHNLSGDGSAHSKLPYWDPVAQHQQLCAATMLLMTMFGTRR